ncbi:3-carboxymuconate cyclase [Actinoplanes sp. ATCC 53533]|uniref:lactonase family protein n=1 Tax=Actinoplanes sp. ATCC 53533 TaxID=1288362 RepID=UPI000F793671|nr:lactonase family protein [Actinoplanes sp. ATCC 53533]RSM54071.1 3-carboxymuconate cyclase [Actinoplanes sp. ATCC 53533]
MGANDEYVFLGCYTGESGGEGEGIALLRRDPATGDLTRLGVVARTPSPSFLAQHPRLPVLYAVNELEAGTVSAFAVADDAALTPLAVQSTGGAAPCHLAVSADARHLLVANYTSGSVSVHPLDADGVPGERSDLLHLDGRGPVADRQEGPHAHMVAPDPNGPDVLIADLGSDRVWRARLDAVSGRLILVGAAVVAAPGTGPRHLRYAIDGALLLVGELAGNLTWYRPDTSDGSLRVAGAEPSSASSANFPSELATGRDGRFVYVANRGPDTVSVFAWEPEGATRIAEVVSGGQWPRHLALLGDHLYVANERSQNVTVFRVDRETGIPQAQGEPVGEGSPTCVLRWIPPQAGR